MPPRSVRGTLVVVAHSLDIVQATPLRSHRRQFITASAGHPDSRQVLARARRIRRFADVIDRPGRESVGG